MYFNVRGFEVWKHTAASGMVDPSYAFSTTISGTYMPISGTEAIRNNQMFADVDGIVICDLSYQDDITDSDELKIDDEFYRVTNIRKYNNILAHMEIYVSTTQWDRS